MVELGELEKKKGDFAAQGITVYAISVDDGEGARIVQERFPGIRVVSDLKKSMVKAFDLIHEGAGPGGTDVAAPTHFLVDGQGRVRSVYRSSAVGERKAADDVLLAAKDALKD